VHYGFEESAMKTKTKAKAKPLGKKAMKKTKGGITDGSLDAGIHFKYDLKGNK
jgi:hypothetical protein